MKRALLPLALGVALGMLLGSEPGAMAEVRRSTPQQAFSSGAMRSEAVLIEIASILRSIDKRVARLEASVARLSANQSGSAGR